MIHRSKCSSSFAFLLALLCWLQSGLSASMPDVPLPLSERVRISTHIFVGTVKAVNFIDEHGKVISSGEADKRCFSQATQYQAYHEAKPQRLFFSPEPLIEREIYINETLRWKKVKPGKSIRFRYRARIFGYFRDGFKPTDMNQLLLGHRKSVDQTDIYLTAIVRPASAEAFLVPCDGPHYNENVKMKGKIKALIKQQNTKGKRSSRRNVSLLSPTPKRACDFYLSCHNFEVLSFPALLSATRHQCPPGA